ncbi:glycosyl transferase [Skermanella stibiiresistens SB22]|uniref:Glycosyl transferase n=1 Tax=Skermanella stibiiresistens SB22 TaxID=1385369 RepID=W9HF60_9PROT|nr:glycosyltransferase family 4 protein [Skermanella stibiiresistens]EWY42538.1 glycosyl transferase [Skermanella stibiiresistens SB22]
MKVAIATVQVPFIRGGAEILAESLRGELVARGIDAEIVSIPFKWYPPTRILDHMLMARMVDLSEVNGMPIDRVVTLKFPAYHVEHRSKVAWVLHQHRQAYDLFETPFGDLHHDAEGRMVAGEIQRWDERLLPAHDAIYTIARKVTDRLRHYNGIESEVLYHPPANAERFRCGSFEPYVLAPGRFDQIKRQHLIIDAFEHLPPSVKLVLIGSTDSAYGHQMVETAKRIGGDRVVVRGVVTEAEKIDLFANCLAVYNGVYDEDYGYVTLEAFLAGKAVITHPDSGGPLEFVQHGENGLIIPPDPLAIADAIRTLAREPRRARALGAAGRHTIDALAINWDIVIERLLA